MFFRQLALLIALVGFISIAKVSFAQISDSERALIDVARDQLTRTYMAAPLPCADPWLAGDDNRITATPAWAQTEGLRPGDVLSSIGGRGIATGEQDGWVHAMRA